MKFEANMLAVIFLQSVQLQMKVSTRPGFLIGNSSCTAPQKHVAVAESSFDQPSEALPDKGMNGLELFVEAIVVCLWMADRRMEGDEVTINVGSI
jgi:hypothetical protein